MNWLDNLLDVDLTTPGQWRKLFEGLHLLVVQLGLLVFGLQGMNVKRLQGALMLMAALAVLAWISNRRRYQAMGNTPVGRIASAAQGQMALTGTARAVENGMLICPGLEMRCLWYRVIVEERNRYANAEQQYRQTTTLQSDGGFLIDDGTGECFIDPDDADIHVAEKEVGEDQYHRYTAWMIYEGDPLYVVGEFVSVRDAHIDIKTALAQKLNEMKRDQTTLLARFDRNGDGRIDASEWEHARASAEQEVLAELSEANAALPAHVMRKPRDGRPFMVAIGAADENTRRYRWQAWVHLAVAALCLHGLLFVTRHPERLPAGWHHPAAQYGQIDAARTATQIS